MQDWNKRVAGWMWIAATIALTVGSCTTHDTKLALSLGELAIPALISLVVATFVPGVQDYLPWGRAWVRWQKARITRGIEELEREVDDEPESVRMDGAPYRGGLLRRPKPRKRRSDRRFVVALVVGSILTALFTLGVAGFVARHDLALTMGVSGLLATLVLAFSSLRDQGRAEAKERLRVEEAVREMEEKHMQIAERADEMEEELERKMDR
jgi:hypothetical protein